MNTTPTILIAEDDDGHAFLIEDTLRRAGVAAPFLRFSDGQELLDFLFCRTAEPSFRPGGTYILSLDIRMPRVDGIEVLRQIKADAELHKLPVMMMTTTDDSREVERCHALGCNSYLQKPVAFEHFAEVIAKLGQFISVMELPCLSVAQGK